MMYNSFFKRFFDITLSFVGFIVILPIFVVVMILLSFANRGNPFFLQSRPGKNGKLFKVIKFKSMTNERNSEGRLLPDDQRLTKIGWFIRITSIDELPQLINVLKGDMALIGPRPLLREYLPLYSKEQLRRHQVRPGITGWAQVNGRNFLPFSKRFELDVWYVDHVSFVTDLKIIYMSVKNILMRKDISIGDHISTDADDLGFTKHIKQ